MLASALCLSRSRGRSGHRALSEDAGPRVPVRPRTSDAPARAPAATEPWAGVSLIPREGARTRHSDFDLRLSAQVRRGWVLCPPWCSVPGVADWLGGGHVPSAVSASPSVSADRRPAQPSPAPGPLSAPLIKESTSVSNQSRPGQRPVDGALFGKRAFADIIKSRLSRGAHPGLGPQTQGSLQDQRSGETQEPCDNGDRAWSDAAHAREAWTPRGYRVGWIPLEPLAGPRPANTLISDFGPPDHERKLFCGCKPPSCGFVPAAARFRLLTG